MPPPSLGDVVFCALVAAVAFGLVFVVCRVARGLSERPQGGGVAVESGQRTARRRRDAAAASALVLGLSSLLLAPLLVWPDVAVAISASLVVLALLAPLLVLIRIAPSRPAVVVASWLFTVPILAASAWLVAGSLVAAGSLPGRLEQEATLAAVRELGEAFEAWRADQGFRSDWAPASTTAEAGAEGEGAAGSPPEESAAIDLGAWTRLSGEALAGRLVPDYLETLPARDGWGHTLELRGALGSAPRLAIRSPGRDGVFSADTYRHGAFPATAFDEDVVWVDGFFVRQPEERSDGE